MVHYRHREIEMGEAMNDDIERRVTDMIHWVYESYGRVGNFAKSGYDRDVRHPVWTRTILDAMDKPDFHTPNIVVTGSKGKGTNAILVAAILERLGFRVGLFTSPHLVDFLERFRINGRQMDSDSFLKHMTCVKKVADAMELPVHHYFGPVGLLAAAAANWFAEQATDINVYELGRGARHDDVNQIRHLGAIVTPIIREHVDKLGPSIENIAWEKAGAITAATEWVVLHPQDGMVRAALDEARKDATLVDIAEDVVWQWVQPHVLHIQSTDQTGWEIRIRLSPDMDMYTTNVAAAVAAVQELMRRGTLNRPMDQLPAELSLERLHLPGRMQRIGRVRWILVDGTVHAQGARFVAAFLREARRNQRQTAVILGLPDDKDGQGVIDVLAPEANLLVFSKAENPHLQFSGKWETYAREKDVCVDSAPTLADAKDVVARHLDEHAAIAFVGTQSFVGDVLRHFSADCSSLWEDVVEQGRQTV